MSYNTIILHRYAYFFWALLLFFTANCLVMAEQAVPAKKLFGSVKTASPVAAQSFGSYVKGCLAGGKKLAVNGPAWQAMRLSRNRNWGHPKLIKYVERLALDSQKLDNWPGLLVGDLAQPRGGPMLTGHRSHQIGLDADIWFMPMPKARLSRAQREKKSAISMLSRNKLSVNPKVWRPGHITLLKRAVSYPEVARIFVHPAIKRALCKATEGQDRSWLHRIRPWWGHHYHFHIRLKCPDGNTQCKDQPEPKYGDGCGTELNNWFKMLTAKPKKVKKPTKPKVKKKKRRQIVLADLPKMCSDVLGHIPPQIAQGNTTANIPLPVRRALPKTN